MCKADNPAKNPQPLDLPGVRYIQFALSNPYDSAIKLGLELNWTPSDLWTSALLPSLAQTSFPDKIQAN